MRSRSVVVKDLWQLSGLLTMLWYSGLEYHGSERMLRRTLARNLYYIQGLSNTVERVPKDTVGQFREHRYP